MYVHVYVSAYGGGVCAHGGVSGMCACACICVRTALLHPWREEMNALVGEESDALPRATRHQRTFRRGESALPVESLFCPAGPKIQLKKE